MSKILILAAWGPHTHIGVDDAIEQGETFMNMLAAARRRRAALRKTAE